MTLRDDVVAQCDELFRLIRRVLSVHSALSSATAMVLVMGLPGCDEATGDSAADTQQTEVAADTLIASDAGADTEDLEAQCQCVELTESDAPDLTPSEVTLPDESSPTDVSLQDASEDITVPEVLLDISDLEVIPDSLVEIPDVPPADETDVQVPKECFTDEDCPEGQTCQGENVCPEGAFCILPDQPGQCKQVLKECFEDIDCPDGQTCVGAGTGCPPGMFCILPVEPTPGVCLETQECYSNEDCPEGQTCIGASVCPEGAYCILPDQPGYCLDLSLLSRNDGPASSVDGVPAVQDTWHDVLAAAMKDFGNEEGERGKS